MREEEWLTSTEPEWMLTWLNGPVSLRKLRLLTVASCRRIWHTMTPCCQKAVNVLELYADDLASESEYVTSWNDVDVESRVSIQDPPTALDYAISSILLSMPPTVPSVVSALSTAASAAGCFAGERASDGVYDLVVDAERERMVCEQAGLLRCIFHNPFRPIVFADSWRSETAVAIATGIYNERAFDRLPILADALQEAGCDQTDILAHCRGPGPHVRGCWVVDLVLGK